MSIEKGWVPVALSADIEPGTSAGAVVDGAEIVVWRDNAGAVHVWEDRCPHRGMRMSFGFVRGDHIACLYHGWAYDTAGLCRYIPAHPELEVPQTIRIPTYAVEERDGLVWTALSADADSAGVPDLGGETVPVRSLYIDLGLSAVEAALAATALPVSEGALQPVRLEKPLGGLFLLSAGETRLAAAAQAIGPQRTALHLLALGRDAGALRAPLARWAEGFRRAAEAAGPQGDTAEAA